MRKATLILALLLVLGLILVQMGCSKDEDPVTPPPACKITMDTPQGVDWEFYFTGNDINIRWAKTTGGNVMIELFKGAVLAGTISASTENDGFFPWTNSTTFGGDSDEDYSIQVTHLSTTGCSDRTGTFEMIDISNCFIKFPWTSRDTIADQVAGSTFDIPWESGHTTGLLNLELWYEPFSGEGELVGIIAENIAADSSPYSWVVDTFHRGTDEGYRLKLRDAAVGAHRCLDRSVPFMITDDDNCSVIVLGISDGGSYDPGQIVPLSFDLENSSGVYKLALYTGREPVTGGLITDSFDSQNGTVFYNWVVEDFGHTGPSFDRYNIVATDVNDEYCVSKNGASFTITR